MLASFAPAVQLKVGALTLAVRMSKLEIVNASSVSAAVRFTEDRAVAGLAADAFPAGRARTHRLLRVTVACKYTCTRT